jgi:hypothetical protein
MEQLLELHTRKSSYNYSQKMSHRRLPGPNTTPRKFLKLLMAPVVFFFFFFFLGETRTTLHAATGKNSVGNKDSYYPTFPTLLPLTILNRTMNNFAPLRYLFSVLLMQLLRMSHRLRGYCHTAIFHSYIQVNN